MKTSKVLTSAQAVKLFGVKVASGAPIVIGSSTVNGRKASWDLLDGLEALGVDVTDPTLSRKSGAR